MINQPRIILRPAEYLSDITKHRGPQVGPTRGTGWRIVLTGGRKEKVLAMISDTSYEAEGAVVAGRASDGEERPDADLGACERASKYSSRSGMYGGLSGRIPVRC